MENKKFWLGIVALVLLFGMTVLGCDENEEDPNANIPFFQSTVSVNFIPSERNGENFTISLIKRGEIKVSKDGIIAGNKAEARLVWNPADPIYETTYGGGKEYVTAYISIKIGNDAPKVTKEEKNFYVWEMTGKIDTSLPLSYQSDF